MKHGFANEAERATEIRQGTFFLGLNPPKMLRTKILWGQIILLTSSFKAVVYIISVEFRYRHRDYDIDALYRNKNGKSPKGASIRIASSCICIT